MSARNYQYDVKMLLSDGAAALTASGFAKVAGANAIIDFGGPQSRSDLGLVGGQARIDAAVVLDILAMTVAADTLQTFWIMGSNNADGSNPVVLAGLQLGYGSLLPHGAHSTGGANAGTGSDSFAGPSRYEILFATEQNGINYEFVYLWLASVGAAPSVQFRAFAAVLPYE